MPRLLPLVLIAVLTSPAFGQEPPKPYRWEDEAKAKGLGDKEIALLKQNKFVIAGEPFRQVFTPYIGSDMPVFITTDSLLNGFHVLFEESIYRVEQQQARGLPPLLKEMANNLDSAAKQIKGDAKLREAARKRAAVFLGTARNLLDAKALPTDGELREIVQQEVKRIVEAKATSKPAWLGPADKGFLALDYSRFLPRGFYSKSPALQRYFRAVSWLQAIPFRLDNDEELAAFCLMHRAFRDRDPKAPQASDGFWRTYRALLGTPDEWDLLSADTGPKELTPEGLADARKNYRERAEHRRSQINDQIRLMPATADGKLELGFRFLSAYALPDSILFQRTMDPKLGRRDLPTGLEVCAVLGSPFARAKLARENPKLLKEIDLVKPLFLEIFPLPAYPQVKENSLYVDYLQCLAVLLERKESDAPALFHTEAWKVKTCQTALGSWAQMRHTWALQAKQSVRYMSSSRCEAGFVEPVPEFYGRMARLAAATRAELSRGGGFDREDALAEIAADFRSANEIVTKARKNKTSFRALSAEEQSLLAKFDPHLNNWTQPTKKEDGNSDPFQYLTLLFELVPDLQKVDVTDLLHEIGLSPPNLEYKWTILENLCSKLETMAHKQLRNVPYSALENYVIKEYGKSLAGIMLYGGNSYSNPRDDAPRIVDVFSNPTIKKHLHVGIAKPRLLWILYPVKGEDILCRGAVLPYHEFAHGDRLTDESWRALLNSPQRPEVPAWVSPIGTKADQKAGGIK